MINTQVDFLIMTNDDDNFMIDQSIKEDQGSINAKCNCLADWHHYFLARAIS
jgi:uncharacterized protein YgfB (UPF0149 family)